MCGSKRSLICCTLLLTGLVAFIIYVAIVYRPIQPPSTASQYLSNDDSWGGTTLATGVIFPDRASDIQVNGVLVLRKSGEYGPYLRFESITIEGADEPMVLILTGAPFPIDPVQRKSLPIELDGVPSGLFFKTGSFNQRLPPGQELRGFKGAIIWDTRRHRLVANVSFK